MAHKQSQFFHRIAQRKFYLLNFEGNNGHIENDMGWWALP